MNHSSLNLRPTTINWPIEPVLNDVVCLAQNKNFMVCGFRSGLVTIYNLNGAVKFIQSKIKLNNESSVSILASGNFLLIKGKQESNSIAEVWDLAENKLIHTFQNRLITIAAITEVNGTAFIVISPEPYVLSIFDLPLMNLRFQSNRKEKFPQYAFQSIILKDEWAFGTGYFKSEKDCFYQFSIAKALSGELQRIPEGAGYYFLFIPGDVSDTVYFLSVGSSGSDNFLFYRNPYGEDDEEDENGEDRKDNPLYAFTGFYIKNSKGELIKKIPYDPIEVHDAVIFSTEKHIVLGLKKKIHIISIENPENRNSIDSEVYFLDHQRSEVIYFSQQKIMKIKIP